MKICNTCKLEKALTDFNKLKSAPDGHQYKCRDCVKLYARENKDRIKEKKHTNYEENKEAVKEVNKAWREANRETLLENKRNYYQATREERDAYTKQYNKLHPESKKTTKAMRRTGVVLSDLSRAKTQHYKAKIKDDPCYYCDKKIENMTDDHYYALARGGTDHWFNIVRSCHNCNSRKSSRLASEFVCE